MGWLVMATVLDVLSFRCVKNRGRSARNAPLRAPSRYQYKAILLVGILSAVVAPARAERRPANQHYDRGASMYVLGRYREALQEFQEAFIAEANPIILFDIGQCYSSLNQPAEAIRAYRNYLHQRPDAENRADVERLIGEQQRIFEYSTPPAVAAPVATPVVALSRPAWLNGATTTQFERVRIARKLRNRGRAALVVGGIFGAVATALTSIAIWQYQARNGGDSAADGHILGPALPGVGLGLIAAPLLIVGPPAYVNGLHAVRDAEEEAGIAPR